MHIINIKNEKTLMRPTSYEKLEKPKIRPTLSFVNYENQEHLFLLKKMKTQRQVLLPNMFNRFFFFVKTKTADQYIILKVLLIC